jgi:glycerol-3-phosphate acyltransferase PlsX
VIRLAVDAMGGDGAPAVNVEGALRFARRGGCGVALVGARDRLNAELGRYADAARLPISLVDAGDVIQMDEAPLAALRRKPHASIRVAADLVARGEAQGLFSAGHTGATFLAAHAALGVIPGVERPALAVTIPTRSGVAILVDAGANLESRPDHLAQFGVMGAAYAQVDLGLAHPRVGLLSIGEEAGKGNDLIREAHAALSATAVGFIGNVEAGELFSGRADVVVCDGFTGNIALKVGEGLVEAIEAMLGDEMRRSLLARAGALLSARAFRQFRQRLDYAEYGGAPLLGVNGVAVVAHGRSSARAVESGLSMTRRLVEQRVIERVAAALGGKSDTRQ